MAELGRGGLTVRLSIPPKDSRMLSLIFRPGPGATTLAVALSLSALAVPAAAQPTQQPDRAQTIPHASTNGKVLGGVKKGTDAAGRGMDRAGDATLSGVNKASESASRPVRKFGEWLGTKLERGPGGGASASSRKKGAAAEAP